MHLPFHGHLLLSRYDNDSWCRNRTIDGVLNMSLLFTLYLHFLLFDDHGLCV